LIARISCGDRDAAALFVNRYGPSIRQRFRVRLSASLRRLMDSSDLLSTIGRRLDVLVRAGGVKVENERQLWALLNQFARAAIVDKARLLRRMQRAEADERHWTSIMERRLGATNTEEEFDGVVNAAFDALPSDVDRRILALWLSDSSYAQIAQAMNMDTAAVRQRWRRIRVRLAKSFDTREVESQRVVSMGVWKDEKYHERAPDRRRPAL